MNSFWTANNHTKLLYEAIRKYHEAVDAWELFVQKNQHKIRMWTVIRREIHTSVQRKEEFLKNEAQRKWYSWENVSQNAHWLVNGSPPQMGEIADALGLAESAYTDTDDNPWYQHFLIDEEMRTELKTKEYEGNLWSPFVVVEEGKRYWSRYLVPGNVIGAAETWAAKHSDKHKVSNPNGGNFLKFGQQIAYLRGYMEYNAQWLRQVLWFRRMEPGSGEPERLETEFSNGTVPSEWLQVFQHLEFSTQVDVLEVVTRKLHKTETGKSILLEFMDADFPFSPNILALFDRDKMSDQRQLQSTVNGTTKTSGLIAEPTDEAGQNTYVKVPPNDRWALSGSRRGKTGTILTIGDRLWHALSRQMGDRSRAKNILDMPDPKVTRAEKAYYESGGSGGFTELSASDYLVESWVVLSKMVGSLLYGTYSDEDLAAFSGVTPPEAHQNINNLRMGRIRGQHRFTVSSANAGGATTELSELESFVSLLSSFHSGVTSLSSNASPVFKLGLHSVGRFIGSAAGFLTAYKMLYHDEEANYQNAIQDALSSVNTLLGVRDQFSDFFTLWYKVANKEGLRTLERVIMEADIGDVDLSNLGADETRYVKSMYNKYFIPDADEFKKLAKPIDDQVDDLLSRGNRYGSTIQSGLTNTVAVIDAAKSAYDSYQLFEVGDYDAAITMGVLGTAGIVGIFVGGWVGVVIELLVLIGTILVAHFTDEPLISWIKQTIFGTMWGKQDYDAEPREVRPQWFKYDDPEEGTARQLSSYTNVKRGFTLSGSGQAMAWYARLVADSGGVIEYDRDIGDPTITVEFDEVPEVGKHSKFVLRPVVQEGDGYALEPPMYVFSMPNNFAPFKSETGHETSFVDKGGSFGTITTQNGVRRLQRNTSFSWDGWGPATKAKLATNEMAADYDATEGAGIHKLELIFKSPSGRFFSEAGGKKPWGVEVIHIPEDNFTGTFEFALAEATGADALKVQSLMLYKKPWPRMIVDINR